MGPAVSLIGYLRKRDKKSWGEIAQILSCEPEQVRQIFVLRDEREAPK